MQNLIDNTPEDDYGFLKAQSSFLKGYVERQRIQIVLMELLIRKLQRKLNKDVQKSNETKEN